MQSPKKTPSLIFNLSYFKMEDSWLETLKSGKCLPEHELFHLCESVKSILIEENNVQPVATPVVICGDIHG